MATLSRMRVLSTVLSQGLVPLFHHDDPEVAWSVLQAVAKGGGGVLEFTNRGDGAHEVFAELQRRRRVELPEFALGVGTVRDAATAALYLNLGAEFVVGPSTEADVAGVCNRWKVPYLPGCATLSEISRAEGLGCEIVKVFPGSAAGGPGFVAAALGPSPRSLLMPTGGVDVTEASLRSWFDAGVAAVGIGGKLISADLVAAEDWDGLADRVREVLATINGLNATIREAL